MRRTASGSRERSDESDRLCFAQASLIQPLKIQSKGPECQHTTLTLVLVFSDKSSVLADKSVDNKSLSYNEGKRSII